MVFNTKELGEISQAMVLADRAYYKIRNRAYRSWCWGRLFHPRLQYLEEKTLFFPFPNLPNFLRRGGEAWRTSVVASLAEQSERAAAVREDLWPNPGSS